MALRLAALSIKVSCHTLSAKAPATTTSTGAAVTSATRPNTAMPRASWERGSKPQDGAVALTTAIV